MYHLMYKWLTVCLLLMGLTVSAFAEERIDPVQLNQQVQSLKSDIIILGNDLAMMDAGILSIAGNPLTLYLSMATDEGFILQAVDLELNGQFAARREFSEKSLRALRAGGVRRLYVSNLPSGKYTIKASMQGLVGKGKVHRSNISFSVNKSNRTKTIELKVTNYRQKYVPEFAIKEWD